MTRIVTAKLVGAYYGLLRVFQDAMVAYRKTRPFESERVPLVSLNGRRRRFKTQNLEDTQPEMVSHSSTPVDVAKSAPRA